MNPAVPPLSPHSRDPSAEHFRRRYAEQMPRISARLGVPPTPEIYTPRENRLAARPRLYFGALTPAELRRRAAAPRFARIVDQIHAVAAKAAALPPPETVQIDAHDPNRAFADSLAWMASSILIDSDPARRARTLAGLLRWVRALRAWGPFETNLSLAQSTIGLSTVYDWLHDELPADERAALRAQIIAQARFSLDETRGPLSMWRGQRFAANHNWAHHSARAFAALALWGDTAAPLQPGELQFWLDDALIDFWIVKHTHTTDGAPLEGPGYQDYGLRFYLDFIAQAEHLLHLRESFFDDGVRALYVRLFTLLPGNRGCVVYADGYPTNWNGTSSFNFRYLAAHFQDGRFQLLAELLEAAPWNHSKVNWRDLFVDDFDLAPAPLEEMPLVGDMSDFGLFTARRDWGGEAAFFCLRCGSASGESVARTVGYDFGEAHAYPNQGSFAFYVGAAEVLPGCPYATLKLTRDHNLVVFEGRDSQAGRVVGQLGEGGAWFNSKAPTDPDADYDRRARPARVLAIDHATDHHHYLCDLGGLYRLRDERLPDGFFFADYLRSLVFLPDGAVAVVDRVLTPVPRTASFRLLTVGEDLSVADGGFGFRLGDVPARIDDFSPVRYQRDAQTESLATRDPCPRAVASLRAADVTEAVFAVVLGVGEAAGRYLIETDARGYTLSRRAGGIVLRQAWPPDA